MFGTSFTTLRAESYASRTNGPQDVTRPSNTLPVNGISLKIA